MLSKQSQLLFKTCLHGVRAKNAEYLVSKVGNIQISRNIQDVPIKREIYELRTYAIYPNKMKEFLSIVNESFQLRTKHSKLAAFWFTEIGGINEVVHLWAYDDLDHRATVRAGLAQNEEWNANFLAKVGHMLQKMENVLLDLHPKSPLPVFSKEAAVFELQLYKMKNHSNHWSEHLKNMIKEQNKLTSNSQSSMVGAWHSVIGPQNCCAIVWQHGSPNDVFKFNAQMQAEPFFQEFAGQTKSHFKKMLNPFVKHLWCEHHYEEKMSW